jgi:[ribosomal protein S5]-alanine N-acetyltransferase
MDARTTSDAPMESPFPHLLHTPRLLLRAPREADALALFDAYTQDAQVARYMTWRPHEELEQTEAFVTACIRAWNDGERLPYILCPAEREHEAIGMLEARLMGHMIDLGYVLARRHWGSGLMAEAITGLTTAALASPAFFRVQASCDVDNTASARTLEKAGFVREGRLERHTVHPNLDAQPRPCFLYALTK